MTLSELEKRMANMEDELASLKHKVAEIGSDVPWWERIAGQFQDDPVYARAMNLGREYRQSLKPAASSGRKKS